MIDNMVHLAAIRVQGHNTQIRYPGITSQPSHLQAEFAAFLPTKTLAVVVPPGLLKFRGIFRIEIDLYYFYLFHEFH